MLIAEAHPEVAVVVRAVSTKGDIDRRAFATIGGKGLFTSEVEDEVESGRADAAVHSAKDLTAELPSELAIVCVPSRAPAHDVVVGGIGGSGEQRIRELAPGAVVGTSSMRRRALLGELRDDLELAELRGNLDTRLAKVASGAVAVAVLAAAGLERLPSRSDALTGSPPERPPGGNGGRAGAGTGWSKGISAAPLDPGSWVPAPGQGTLAIQARRDRADVAALLAPLEDSKARAELECERGFAERLEGGCSVPLGCLAQAGATTITARGYLGRLGGGRGIRKGTTGPLEQARAVGARLAEAILSAGGERILAGLRDHDLVEAEEP